MSRTILPVAALALGLAAASASAQSALSPFVPPEGSTAARTLEQNRRVSIGQPRPSEGRGAAVEPGAPARDRTTAAPAIATGRVDLAAGEKPGARR
jgi:hypothetical protein